MQTVVAALIRQDGKILIAQRSRAATAHPLQWEFPGGKVEPNETEERALVRELEEELGITAHIGQEFTRYKFAYFGKPAIQLAFFELQAYTGTVKNRIGFEALHWANPSELKHYRFLEGDLPLIELLGEIDVDQIK